MCIYTTIDSQPDTVCTPIQITTMPVLSASMQTSCIYRHMPLRREYCHALHATFKYDSVCLPQIPIGLTSQLYGNAHLQTLPAAKAYIH